MSDIDHRIIRQVFQVINRTIFEERKRVFQVDDVSLYPSEVHLLLAIAGDNRANSTRIAQEFGLTKGAVSQTLTRLRNKGVIRKDRNPENRSELLLSLTPFGRKACRQCLKSQSSLTRAYESYLSKLKRSEKEVVLDFLRHMEQSFRELP
jgi:DNA-binding MarR family transcriptional regulator